MLLLEQPVAGLSHKLGAAVLDVFNVGNSCLDLLRYFIQAPGVDPGVFGYLF